MILRVGVGLSESMLSERETVEALFERLGAAFCESWERLRGLNPALSRRLLIPSASPRIGVARGVVQAEGVE